MAKERNNREVSELDLSSSEQPPPLRPPTISQAQLRVAINMGFSSKYLPSEQNLPPGQFRPGELMDKSPAGANGNPAKGDLFTDMQHYTPPPRHDAHRGGRQGNYAEEEGLLPPLRAPNFDEIPPEVLALVLKSPQVEEMVAAYQNQDRGNNPGDSVEIRNLGKSSNCSGMSGEDQEPQLGFKEVQTNSSGGVKNGSRSSLSQTSGLTSGQPRSEYSAITKVPSSSTSKPSKVINFNPHAVEFHPGGTLRKDCISEDLQYNNMPEEADLAAAIAQIQMQSFHPSDYLPTFNNNPPPPAHTANFDNHSQLPTQLLQQQDDNADFILSAVTEGIAELTDHPANFSRVSKRITELLKDNLRDSETFGVVVTLLIEQSISIANFCYSGARLAQVLHKSNLCVKNVPFKTLLIQSCQDVFKECLKNIEEEKCQVRCRGLLMFFAELFMNVRVEVKGKSQPYAIFGLAMLEVMQNLVKYSSHDNIKCICQALKLIGYEMESLNHQGINSNLEPLLKDLSYLSATGALKPQTTFLVDALFKLKNNRWNMQDSCNTRSQSVTPQSSHSGGNDHVFELPDSDEDALDDDCILMDDEPPEVQDAYDDFLKSIGS